MSVRPFKDLDSYSKFFSTGLGPLISFCSWGSRNLETSSAPIRLLQYEPPLLVSFVAIAVIYWKCWAFKLQLPAADVVEANIHASESKWTHRVAAQRPDSILISNSYLVPVTWRWDLVGCFFVALGLGGKLGVLGKSCRNSYSLLQIHSFPFLPLRRHSRRRRHCSSRGLALHPLRHHS